MHKIINHEFNDHINVCKDSLNSITASVEKAAKICVQSLKDGGKILILGNGGSAADAQHIAAELVGRYKTERKGLAAIALTTDSSVLTAVSNDYGNQHIFDRQVEALANHGDVVIGISTSGSSSNVINALNLAKKLSCKTIGLSGKSGGSFNNLCDVNIVAQSKDTARIQEIHILVGHTICHLIELELSYSKK